MYMKMKKHSYRQNNEVSTYIRFCINTKKSNISLSTHVFLIKRLPSLLQSCAHELRQFVGTPTVQKFQRYPPEILRRVAFFREGVFQIRYHANGDQGQLFYEGYGARVILGYIFWKYFYPFFLWYCLEIKIPIFFLIALWNFYFRSMIMIMYNT